MWHIPTKVVNDRWFVPLMKIPHTILYTNSDTSYNMLHVLYSLTGSEALLKKSKKRKLKK